MSGVAWTEGSFTYDGTKHSVTLTGLPEGVTATYQDNEATNAGTYTAKATLAYDSANYYAPVVEDYDWTIEEQSTDPTIATQTPTTTTAPSTTTAPNTSSDAKPNKSKGCSGVVSINLAALFLISLSSALIIKRRKEQ